MTVLLHISDTHFGTAQAEVAQADTFAAEWLEKVCAGKDMQARIPDELKDKKLGE